MAADTRRRIVATNRKFTSVASDATRSAARSLLHRARSRRARPWLGMVGAPLAFMATALAERWPLLPLLGVCMWWWAPRAHGWEWLVAVQAGAVGVQWAFMGAFCLAGYPDQRPLVAAIWIGGGLLIAAICAYNRRRAVVGY